MGLTTSPAGGGATGVASITGGTATGLTALGLRSTGAAFDLTLGTSEVLTAGRTLRFNVGDADRTLTIPVSGTVALLGVGNAFNGAASAPALALTGSPFTGGTATTTKPLFVIEPTGTTSTGWATAGTMFGVNAASGFGGSLISAQVASAERFRVQANGVIQLNGDTAGTLSRRTDVGMIMMHSVGSGNVGVVGIGGPGFLQGISMAVGSALQWTNDSPASSVDVALRRQAAGILDLSATGSTTGAALQFSEQTAPAAPAANSVRIYAVDNGAGKTQLMALFASGAAQQIAIQP